MRTTSGRGSGAALALLAAILMPLLGFGTAGAQGVGDKVTLLVPDLQEFPEGAAEHQFTVMAETQNALWLVQDTCWVDVQGGSVSDLDTLLYGQYSFPENHEWDVTVFGEMLTMDEFNELTQVFESTVWPTVTGKFGQPVLNNSGKVWIVIAAIPTKWNSSPQSQVPRNQMYHVNPDDLLGEFNGQDIFYLNVHALAYNPQLLSHAEQMRRWNLANGLTALIRFSNNPGEDRWLVRGIAESAQYDCFGFTSSAPAGVRYGHRMILNEFEKASGIELINYRTGTGSNDYSASRGQGFLFFMYLRQRLGDAFLQRLAQGEETGMLNVALAIEPSADPETAVQEHVLPLYWDWLVCNLNHRFYSDYAGGIYHYQFLEGTDYEDFAHANSRATAGFAGRFTSYPIEGWIADPAFAMSAPVWSAQYSFFRSLEGTETPVFFNGQFSDGSGGESAVDGRWEGLLVAFNEAEQEFVSITPVSLNDFYNGSFELDGDASYLIVTCNNPGGASNLRYYISQDDSAPNLEVAIHQNQISDNVANVFAVPVDPDTREMEGFDWVGPILSVTRGTVTTPVKMDKFFGGMMWRGNINLTSNGNYTINFSGFDSTGIAISNTAEMAVGTAGAGRLLLDVRGIRLEVPEGGAPSGSRVVLAETGMLGLNLEAGGSIAHSADMLTGVLAGPVSIPDVSGTISFPAQNGRASVYRHTPDGWVRLDSYFQNGSISAPVSTGGIYVLGEAPGVSSPALPAMLELSGNFPNPFTAQTVIRFATPSSGLVTMRIFDLSGRLVRTLANEDMAAANHSIVWDGTDANGKPLGAGVYFCRLEAQGQVLTQKIMMVQ